MPAFLKLMRMFLKQKWSQADVQDGICPLSSRNATTLEF